MAGDSITVRLSRMGENAQPVARHPEPDELDRHIDEFPYVEMAVSPDTSLGRLAREGADLHGFPPDFEPGYVEFRDPGKPSNRTGLLTTLVLVDEDGHATFGHYWADVPLAAALRAHEMGALAGDPTHLVIVPHHAFGNGIFLEWGEVLAALSLLWQTLSAVTTADGAYQLSQRLAGLFRRREQGEKAQHVDWRQRGAMPADVHEFINRRSTWSTQELASLLGCSNREAEAFLAGKGFVWDDQDAVWRRAVEPRGEAGLIDSLDALVMWADLAEEGGEERFKQHVRLVVQEYFRTGRAPTPMDLYYGDGR